MKGDRCNWEPNRWPGRLEVQEQPHMAGNSLTPPNRALSQGRWNHVMVYGTSLVLLILSIPLGLQAGFPYAVASLLLAALSFSRLNM
jgi:hypothetical protein